MKKGRIITILLALCMVLSTAMMTAFAGGLDTDEGDAVCSITVDGVTTYYATLGDAYDYTSSHKGATIKLLKDIDFGSGSFSFQRQLTLDLNGHSIESTSGAYTISSAYSGDLTVIDSSESQTGKITNNLDTTQGVTAVAVNYGGTVTLKSGTIESRVYCLDAYGGSNITIEGGTIISGRNGGTLINESGGGGTNIIWVKGGSFSDDKGNRDGIKRPEGKKLYLDADGFYRLHDILTVSFDPNGGKGTMEPAEVGSGFKYTLPDNTFEPGDDEHLYKEWEVTIGGDAPIYKKPGEDITVTADTVVKPVWSEYWTVSFDPTAKGSGQMDPIKVIKGDKVKLPANEFTSTTHSFKNWKVGSSEYAVDAEVEITANTTVYANWTPKSWKVFVNGIQADGDNYQDMLGDMDEGATVVYDPMNKILTLNDATIEADTCPGTTRYSEFGVRIGEEGVKIVLKGENHIKNDVVTAKLVDESGKTITNNHVYGMYFSTDCTVKGGGSLTIGMAADKEDFELFRGIESYREAVLDGAKIDINIPGTIKTNGYRIVNRHTLTMRNTAELHIDVDVDAADTYALDSSTRNNVDLSVGEDCVFEAISRKTVAIHDDDYIWFTDETDALGALAGKDPSPDTARVWDVDYDTIGNYKYFKIPYSVDKSSIEPAISAARDAEKGVKTSVDGKELDNKDIWTTAAEKKALDDAIAVAQRVLDDPSAPQHEVDKTVEELKKATETYNKAKKAGNKPGSPRFSVLRLRSTKQSKNSITLSWARTKGATTYVVYGNACGSKHKMKKLASLGNKNKYKVRKISKKLKKGTYYKFTVVALDRNNHVLSTSKAAYVATKGGKVTNPKKVTVKKDRKTISKLKLSKGKTARLKSKVTKASAGLKLKKHRAVLYESSDSRIVSVGSKSGKVKAKAKGTCYIYAYAQNGVCKKIKVIVK